RSSTSTSTTTLPPTTTACDQVVHIGDSLGVHLWEPEYVGGDEHTMSARYAEVGVTTVYPDNAPGRSTHERTASAPVNAVEVALGVRANGYRGCWVLMIGTNDAANVAAGANRTHDERITAMLDVIGDDPLLWVDARTTLSEGPWANSAMEAWNEALYRITAPLRNVAIVPWSELARPEWFTDGIHHTAAGRAHLTALVADALVEHFP